MPRAVSGKASVEESIVLAVLDLSNQLGKLGEGLAGHAGLTTQQWLVLLQVAGDPNFHAPGGRASRPKGGVLASEIAEARGVSRANVSTLVAQLLGKGLVRQDAEAGDRRRKGLSITAKGRAALARLDASRRHANRVLLAELDTKGRAALLRSLRACLRCAAASVAAAPEPRGSTSVTGG
ncbi:MAG: MarR family winged helix-turn-helix transcriptional regulator [Vicinamibacteria bacterium]|nr:MarR family winged helix-turn-helix transcriptional regulator [Vicinamibacteria bacterium]